MIAGLDSSTQPSAAQALAARAAGVSLWSGYLQTQPNVGLYAPWSQQGFENARLCGSTPIAFCSGWDNPAALKGLAASWNLRLCLDVENGIRGNGLWVQGFLNASGAGLYANSPYHGYTAPFHILAGYPGSDPGATWQGPIRPVGACGWQWEGTHTEFGVGVDRGWYDDWFASTFGPQPGNQGEDMRLIRNQDTGAIAALDNSAHKSPINAIQWGLLGSAPPAGYGDAYRDINQAQWDSFPDATGIAGPAGPAGAAGLQGTQGLTGPQGTSGPQGAPGSPGVTPIHDHPLQGFTGKT